MNQIVRTKGFSRRALLKGGALTVGFAMLPAKLRAQGAAGSGGRVLDPKQLDAFLAIKGDGTVVLYSGKVDLGQGLRIALPQIAAEELGIDISKIEHIEGDTALTPNQGRTSGSNGIQQGGVQIRQAAATARKALIDLAAQRMNVSADELEAVKGEVRRKSGGTGLSFASLVGDKQFNVQLDPNAPRKDPKTYTLVGKSLPRPDVPAKCTGTAQYVHDFSVPNMLHARIIRPPAIGAELRSVDESSIASIPGVKAVRIKNFLAVVGDDEWRTVRAAKALKAQWSDWSGLPEQSKLIETMLSDPGLTEQTLINKGTASKPDNALTHKARYYWPMQSHASLGPSCAVADVRTDQATIWTASQGTHGNQTTYARFLKLPKEKVRLIYLEGSGCYGMNGHEDAGAEAAILSQALGRPVRVQWTRAEELGWDPKGPPQVIEVSGSLADGRLVDWRTDMWIAQTTKGLLNIPLIGPEAAGLDNIVGLNTGLITQNGDPPYAAGRIEVVAHWLKAAPLRPAPIRSPGKPANVFAVESFMDELATAAKLDPVAFRLDGLKDPRGVEVLKRTAQMMRWQPRPSPGSNTNAAVARGRGIAYLRYKHTETYVGMGMDVAVERASGRIKVERVCCAHDCGQMINPDGVRAQLEGSIIQTLSRVLMEEVKFDRSNVTSLDWVSYPIMRMPDVPKIDIEMIDRQTEKPMGAGEAACAVVGAALANAVFDATGVRLRSIPFTPETVKAQLNAKA